MERPLGFSEVEGVLTELNYPIARESAARELAHVTLSEADGNVALGGLIAASASSEFESVDDVLVELQSR